MDRDQYTDESYSKPHVPPATPPTVDANADPLAAAELANDNGDSDHPGPREADIERGGEDADIAPGEAPDEVMPDEGDLIEPTGPAEIDIERGGDIDEPGRTPGEIRLPPD